MFYKIYNEKRGRLKTLIKIIQDFKKINNLFIA